MLKNQIRYQAQDPIYKQIFAQCTINKMILADVRTAILPVSIPLRAELRKTMIEEFKHGH